MPSVEELVIPLKERKTIQTLTECSCRWPIGVTRSSPISTSAAKTRFRASPIASSTRAGRFSRRSRAAASARRPRCLPSLHLRTAARAGRRVIDRTASTSKSPFEHSEGLFHVSEVKAGVAERAVEMAEAKALAKSRRSSSFRCSPNDIELPCDLSESWMRPSWCSLVVNTNPIGVELENATRPQGSTW